MIEPKISFAFEKRARVASHLNFLKIEFSEYKENLKNLMSGSIKALKVKNANSLLRWFTWLHMYIYINIHNKISIISHKGFHIWWTS